MTLKKFFNTSSIFTKVSIMTSCIIILISVLSTTFLVRSYSREIQNRDRLLVQEGAAKLFSFFQDSYNNMYNQRTLIHSSDHIADVLSETRDNPSDVYEMESLNKITNYLTALAYSDTDIEDVILFTADGENAFSYSSQKGRKIYFGYAFNELPYIEKFRENSSSIAVIYDKDPPYLTLSSSEAPKETITFIMKIYAQLGMDTKYPLAYMMVNYSPDTVQAAYNDIQEDSDGEYYILNSLSTVVYSNNKARMGQAYNTDWIDQNNILFHKTIGLSGIEVIGSVSNDKLSKTILFIIRNAVIITGIGILCMIIFVLILHRHYARKFQNLGVAMASISTGDFSTYLPVNSNDEIGYLSRTFNQMSQTLNDYIEKTYLAETQRRTAELYALQAQINPHFLANTIESIRMCALENDDYESSEMLKELGNLFRWMVQFDQDIIYVENEMEYTESYLNLLKFRFSDKLSVDMEIPSESYLLGIPRFTLQPILENAVSHGSPNTRNMLISICFTIEDNILTITVSDNGPGIPENDLKKLQDHIRGNHTCKEFGVALRNIHSRITLLFGNEYGLKVKSSYGQGAAVIVTLPAKEKKELEKYVQNTHSGR